MASETKTKEDKAMAADSVADTGGASEEPRGNERPPERHAASKAGFFTIYKKGQGYWTRMGTAIGAGLLCILVTWQVYRYIPAFMSTADATRARNVALGVAGGLSAPRAPPPPAP